MYKTRLTPRQIKISFYLLEVNDYISSAELAERFEVSVRTIKNEMAYIRDWLNENNEELTSGRGKGYRIICSKERRRELSLFLRSKERFFSPMDRQMRTRHIIVDLFFSTKPLTIMYLSNKLLVSPNTIFSDFTLLAEEFKKANIYVKSDHKGYSLAGEEKLIREVVSNLLEAELTNFDISKFVDQLSGKNENISGFTAIFANQRLEKIYQTVVRYVMENLSLLNKEVENYTIFSLMIRLCLSIARLQNDRAVGRTVFKEIKNKDKITDFLFSVYKVVGCPCYEEEFKYVSSEQVILGQINIPRFTEKLIRKVGELSHINFSADTQLFQNLYTHFSLTLAKNNNITGYNPFVNDLKIKQLEIFNFVEKACSEYLPKSIKIDDSFIGYATLHFLASIERQESLERRISVLYVCATGVGVASFIQKKIAKAIKGIEIVGFSSIANVQVHIKKLKPDLIVSVFPIEKSEFPVIEVNALLTNNDLLQIQNQVNLLLNAGLGSVVINEKRPEAELSDVSVELISKAFNIYSDLKTLFKRKLPADFLEGFLLHILLMVNRVVNDKQYQMYSLLSDFTENKKLIKQIDAICKVYDLEINHSEISALLPYYEYFDKQKK